MDDRAQFHDQILAQRLQTMGNGMTLTMNHCFNLKLVAVLIVERQILSLVYCTPIMLSAITIAQLGTNTTFDAHIAIF